MDYRPIGIQGTKPNTLPTKFWEKKFPIPTYYYHNSTLFLNSSLVIQSISKYFLGSRGLPKAEKSICLFLLCAGHVPPLCRRGQWSFSVSHILSLRHQFPCYFLLLSEACFRFVSPSYTRIFTEDKLCQSLF